MSTQKQNITARRIAKLLSNNETIFHLKDLANLWNMGNYNTLRTTLKRYCKNQLIYRIYKGFYAVMPPARLDPILIGSKAIHNYCYLTTESVLFLEGFISKKITQHTFVSEKSKRFTINKNHYISRQLNPKHLLNPEGITLKNGFKKANIYRAIADMLYFNPKYHFDRKVDWNKVKKIQKKVGYPLTPKRYAAAKSK